MLWYIYWVEWLKLSMKYRPQLIWHTFGITYLDIHVVVGVAIYPMIDAADLDVVLQFNRENSVILAYGKLGALYLEGSNMMGCDNLSSGHTAWYRVLQDSQTPFMFSVKIRKDENISIKDDAPEFAYHSFRIICLLQENPENEEIKL